MEIGETARTAPVRFPCCGAEVDAHAPLGGGVRAPAPGDVTLCAECGAILVFREGGGVGVSDESALGSFPEEVREAFLAARAEVFGRVRVVVVV